MCLKLVSIQSSGLHVSQPCSKALQSMSLANLTFTSRQNLLTDKQDRQKRRFLLGLGQPEPKVSEEVGMRFTGLVFPGSMNTSQLVSYKSSNKLAIDFLPSPAAPNQLPIREPCGWFLEDNSFTLKAGRGLTNTGTFKSRWPSYDSGWSRRLSVRHQIKQLIIKRRRALCVSEIREPSQARMKDKRKEQQKRSARAGPYKPVSTGYWRIFGVEVPLEKDFGKDHFYLSEAVLEAIASILKCNAALLPHSSFSVVRKSLDARKDPKFVYTIDLDVADFWGKEPGARTLLSKLRAEPGKVEFSIFRRTPLDLVVRLQNIKAERDGTPIEVHSCFSGPGDANVVSKSIELPNTSSGSLGGVSRGKKPRVVVVGSGPAGLFAALSLAETGTEVVLLERGQPVETRGRDIGALMVRRLLDPNSNLCYGEGGAGTWSDGKLTTRIGKNGSRVQTVLATLVRFGASPQILVDGKPHLGTDKLVRILQGLRSHLLSIGVNIMFGTKMEDLEVHAGRVIGVRISRVAGKLNSLRDELLGADAVVLAVGHSARDVYDRLLHHSVSMTAKPFAVGFRVEHPQELINEIQYHGWANEVQRGKGKLPVADYKLATDVLLPVEDGSIHEKESRGHGCFSFCMCPGGQIVPTSTSASELCINGMSFSNRASRWANAALVVSVSAPDFSTLVSNHGPLAGVAFQRNIEQQAALRGGGNFVTPVQTVTDFLDDRLSVDALPSSSYRLGVRAAPLHDLLPSYLTESLKEALLSFEKQLPGFVNKRALLHGVETRTSSPVIIERHKELFESLSLPGLYPAGEGAGHAGGIVSAAVDGMLVGLALAKRLSPSNTSLQELSM